MDSLNQPTSITYSTEMTYLECALEEQAHDLLRIRAEMDSFEPLPAEAFEERMRAEISRVKAINPPDKGEWIETMVKRDFAIGYSPEIQFFRQFENVFPAKLASITLLSHALCEAAINASLVIGLNHVGKAQLFPALESNSLIDKWTVGPLAFLDTYRIPTSGILFSTLKALCKKRNALTHQKIRLKDGEGNTVSTGNVVGVSMKLADRLQLQRFTILPYALQANLIHAVNAEGLSHFLNNLIRKGPPIQSSAEQMVKSVR